MEIHHHSHTPRKSWKHYFWEFLMLFLAVFAGFLAENQREHFIEHQREKKFIHSLKEDLKEDAAEIRLTINRCDSTKMWQDSTISYFKKHLPLDYIPSSITGILMSRALPRLSVTFNEVTALQLKNAGNLRLIRNEEVGRKISLYWKEQETVKINMDRFLIYRNRGREYEEQLFEFYNAFAIGGIDSSIINNNRIKVLTNDPKDWIKYSNILIHCRVTTIQLKTSLDNILKKNTELISLIENKY